jgi:hypothetical protein
MCENAVSWVMLFESIYILLGLELFRKWADSVN